MYEGSTDAVLTTKCWVQILSHLYTWYFMKDKPKANYRSLGQWSLCILVQVFDSDI